MSSTPCTSHWWKDCPLLVVNVNWTLLDTHRMSAYSVPQRSHAKSNLDIVRTRYITVYLRAGISFSLSGLSAFKNQPKFDMMSMQNPLPFHTVETVATIVGSSLLRPRQLIGTTQAAKPEKRIDPACQSTVDTIQTTLVAKDSSLAPWWTLRFGDVHDEERISTSSNVSMPTWKLHGVVGSQWLASLSPWTAN